jgi:zinc transport system ATP-binding protein
MSPPLLRCDGLVVGYRGRPLLPAFDLAIQRGELIAIVGQNGAGKSTLIKTLLGLIPPVAGVVDRRGAALSYLPQAAVLDELVPISARAVVGWSGLRGRSFLRPWASRAERLRVDDALEQTGVAAFADQPYRELSGGQKQRVLLARLIASGADLAVLDEPTASLDTAAERVTYEQLAELAHRRDLAVVVVTHTVAVAFSHADRVVFVERGDDSSGQGGGRVVIGSPAEVSVDHCFARAFPTVAAAFTSGELHEEHHHG